MLINRPRRLRGNKLVREMSREVRASVKSLIMPLFVVEGSGIKSPIPSLDGQWHYSTDRIGEAVQEALAAGVSKILLFGLPQEKDKMGSGAYDDNGVVQRAIRSIRSQFGDRVCIVTDVCMCEYTSHGHCGLLRGQQVDNDATLAVLQRIALSHAHAGADIIAPSDMMDGRVGAIRHALDSEGFIDVSIMSYAVKYASAFYGPFREAAGSAPAFGDRKSYQMDWHNRREAVREAQLDISEGADIIMVKPAMSYLDVVAEISAISCLPVAAYSVSGEYAMVKAAAAAGLIDEYAVMCEMAGSVFRAGAGILISYYAKEIAQAITRGDIG